MEPLNLGTIPYTNGHSYESRKAFSIRGRSYHCGRFNENVGSGNICDDLLSQYGYLKLEGDQLVVLVLP